MTNDVPGLVDHLFRHEAARMTATLVRILGAERIDLIDLPYAEATEVIGGYFTIDAPSYDEAVSIARGCPHLKYSGRIEVREVDIA